MKSKKTKTPAKKAIRKEAVTPTATPTPTSHRPRGEKHPLAKLADKDIKAIRKAYKSGVAQAELARHYGVSVTYMHKIVHNQARA